MGKLEKNKQFDKLREKAKQLLKEKGHFYAEDLPKDFDTVLEELNIYQIELEQQNHDLLQTQKKLEESENKYRDLFENAPYPYIITNIKDEITDFNKAALDFFFGYTCRIIQ